MLKKDLKAWLENPNQNLGQEKVSLIKKLRINIGTKANKCQKRAQILVANLQSKSWPWKIFLNKNPRRNRRANGTG